MMTRACVALLAMGALAACQKSPQDQQAEAIKSAADRQASQIEAQAKSQAAALEQQAEGLHAQAKQAGGYTGQRLQVRGDALAREADIVKRQAQARADATREIADAQAKVIASR